MEYYLESQQSAEALSSPHLNFYISYILLFNLHLNEAKFWFEKLLFHSTFISLCLFGLNLNVSIFIKPISKIGWYQENLSYFLTGSKYLFQIKAAAQQIRWQILPTVEIKCRRVTDKSNEIWQFVKMSYLHIFYLCKDSRETNSPIPPRTIMNKVRAAVQPPD